MGYPAGWEQRQDSEGQVYSWIATRRETLVSIHADSSYDSTRVEGTDPQQPAPHLGLLPKGWEME